MSLQSDPRTAPSVGIEMCTHAAWVLVKAADGGRCQGSKHLKLCVSFVVLQCLARLRLGLHGLQIRLGRIKGMVPRPDRLCRLCSTVGAPFYGQRPGEVCVEDVKHFVLECPAYGHIRSRYSAVFGTAPALCSDMHTIFDCDHQDQLAHAVRLHNGLWSEPGQEQRPWRSSLVQLPRWWQLRCGWSATREASQTTTADTTQVYARVLKLFLLFSFAGVLRQLR